MATHITNTAWVRARLCKLQKGCTRLAAASDKVYQLLVHGRWFSPASLTTKTVAILWQPCLLMDRDEMSNLYRGPSIDASYQVSVHLAEGFQRRRLKCERLTDDG
jgi:hypothetical protein